jgi:hypothetical protein
MTVNLDGVRLRTSFGLGRPSARSLARRSLVSYQIIEEPAQAEASAEPPKEKRSMARRRVRLRSGKLLDQHNKFICECLLRDQSAQGLCLLLTKNVGLPARYLLHDDDSGSVEAVVTMWRRGALLGVRYCSASRPAALKASDRASLRGKYYAILD